jgi:hypothetical protein
MSIKHSATDILAATVGEDPQNPFGLTYQHVSDENARFFGRWWSERAPPPQRPAAVMARAIAAAVVVNRQRGELRRRAVARARAAGITGNKAIAVWIRRAFEIEISARQVGRILKGFARQVRAN